MLQGSWAAQGLSFANPVTLLRVILGVTAQLPAGGTVNFTFGITKVSSAAADAGVMPDPEDLADARRRWLINNTWRLIDPTIVARVTPQPFDLRGRLRLEPNDRLVLITRNHATSTEAVQSHYGWRALVALH